MKKLLSRLFSLVLILVLTFSMVSCWLTEKRYEGLGEFSRFHSSVDICMCIPEEMIEKFQYIDGDYHFYSSGLTYDKMLLYLSYNEDEYQKAKSYATLECQIEAVNYFESFNSYMFYNIWNNNEYPYHYTLVGFNDTDKTIVFLGFFADQYNGVSPSNFPFTTHIIEHFGDWYDFE